MAHYGNNGHHEQGNGGSRDAGDRIDPGRIFVGGLSWQTTEETLICYFEKYGKVNSAEIMRDKVTGDPRGFGFVLFKEDETIDEIMKNRPHEIDNKMVDVKRAQKAIPRTEFIRDKIARGIPPPNHHYHPRDAQDPRVSLESFITFIRVHVLSNCDVLIHQIPPSPYCNS
jgi:RNA recognition motif-containing protein